MLPFRSGDKGPARAALRHAVRTHPPARHLHCCQVSRQKDLPQAGGQIVVRKCGDCLLHPAIALRPGSGLLFALCQAGDGGGSAYHLSLALPLRSGRASLGHTGSRPGLGRRHKDKKQQAAVLPALQERSPGADLPGAGIHFLQGSASRTSRIGGKHLRSLRALLHDPAGEGGQWSMYDVTALTSEAKPPQKAIE
jgi:hypothetical protein